MHLWRTRCAGLSINVIIVIMEAFNTFAHFNKND